jgi:ketosteroid isomerase-like protein
MKPSSVRWSRVAQAVNDSASKGHVEAIPMYGAARLPRAALRNTVGRRPGGINERPSRRRTRQNAELSAAIGIAPSVNEDHPSALEAAQAVLDAFNAHDLDRVMSYFDDDCRLDMPRGRDPWGQRFIGKAAVREALAGRLQGLPDVHYGDARHWGSGERVVSEWLLTGTRPSGEKVEVRGCDHYEFRGGKIIRKDSYWKIVEPP